MKKKRFMGNFIPATEDWCAKELFENKEVREGFLSDILKIPQNAIKETRIMNTALWKRVRKEKQGIVDIRILLNNNRIINIEIQLMRYDHWDKRQIFYLSKMYTENARRGEDYDNLPDCISIAILGFNLTEDADYYHCYKLRDEHGRIFSEAVTVYILELEKTLGKDKVMDDWIRVFRAKNEEELDMITTQNKGILAAIKELKTIGLTNILREEYEYRLKVKRDTRARESYVRKEGKAEGKAELILELLEELGEIPEEIERKIRGEMNLELLSKWHRQAVKAESMEWFIINMDNRISENEL